MSQEFCTESEPCVAPGSLLRSGYDELMRVDQALREAERQLDAAHRFCTQHRGPVRAQDIYLQVLVLRDRARQVLQDLAEIWAADR